MAVHFEDHSHEVEEALRHACLRILEMWGIKIERYAKKLCPVGTPESTGKKGYRGGTLRNSITHEVQTAERLAVGSNVEYAPYVELGTGPYFTPPPEWEQFDTPPASGLGHSYVTARPFIRPAIEDHVDEYKRIMERELKNG